MVDKSKTQNEYFINPVKKDSLKSVLSEKDNLNYYTPLVTSIFALCEMLGISQIKPGRKVLPIVKFTSHGDAVCERLGIQYVMAMVVRIQKTLLLLGISEFERNTKNRKWKLNFEVTDKKLDAFFKESMGGN